MCMFRIKAGFFAGMIMLSIPVWAANTPAVAPPPATGESQTTLVQIYMQIQNLRQQVRSLTGQNQVLEHQIQRLRERQRRLYMNIDKRLQALEASSGQNPSVSAASTSLAPPTTAVPTPPASSATTTQASSIVPQTGSAPNYNGKDLEAYQKAFNLLMNSHYKAAITAFESFESAYPRSPYVANAEYWIGEAYYVEQMYKQALKHFQNVIYNYPQSNKVPAALLKIGYCYDALKQWSEARKTLQSVINQYPGTTEARLAMDRLRQMQSQGH